MNSLTHQHATRVATWVPSSPRARTSPAEGRRWVRSMVPVLLSPLPPPAVANLLDKVELLVTEMITNAVRHGAGRASRDSSSWTADAAYGWWYATARRPSRWSSRRRRATRAAGACGWWRTSRRDGACVDAWARGNACGLT